MAARNHDVHVKLSAEELEKITKKADEVGLKPSQFLRASALSPYLFLDKSQIKK